MRRIFETGLEKLGRIIGSQYDIRIVFRGTGASTDGKTIYLPSSDNLTPELMADMHGFLDHEVAHCRFTDFKQLEKLMKGKGGRFQKDLLNACEDSRIEILQIEDLPGCRLNLEPLNTKYRGLAEDAIRAGKVPWPMKLIFAIRAVVDNREPLVDAEFEEIFNKVKGDAPLLRNARSTEEIRKAAEVITKKVLDLLDDEPESEEGEGEEGDEEGENSNSEGGSGSGEGEDQDEQESEAEASGKASSGKKKGKTKRSAKGDKMMDDKADSSSKEWDAMPINVDAMMEKNLEKHFEKMPPNREMPPETKAIGGVPDPDRTQLRGKHSPFTTEFDKVIDLSGQGSKPAYRRLRQDARSMTSMLKSKLERLLKIRQVSKWRSERDYGSIDRRSLPKLLTDRNYTTPFREYVRAETLDTVVEILVDSSGSMHHKMTLTKQTLIALAEALKELQIPFEVTGFIAMPDGQMDSMARTAMAEARSFNRWRERLEHRIFKSFESNDLTGIERLEAGGNNCDPESVKWAANRLSMRKEKRKILIVMSDGQPTTGDGDMRLLRGALKNTVDAIMRSGMEVVGMGIMDNAVTEFYKDNVVIHDIKDLPTKAMQKLTKLLTK